MVKKKKSGSSSMYNTEQVTLHTSLATCGNSVAPVSGGLENATAASCAHAGKM